MGLPRDPASSSAGDENHEDDPVQQSPGAEDLRTNRGRPTRIRGLAAAALVGVLACAGYEGWLLFQQHRTNVAAQQALAAAEKYAVTLTSIDSATLDKHVAEVLDGSTGEFNDNYAKTTSGQHSQRVVNNKVKTHGKVVESAVKSAATNKVQVLLMVDQSVSSLATPEPQIDRSRIKMTMQKVDGRWLVSKVELL
jgi:Mce-associated membrane protein